MKSSNCLVGSIHKNKHCILNRVEICANKIIYQDNGTLFNRFQICKSQFEVLTMQTCDLPSAARFLKKQNKKHQSTPTDSFPSFKWCLFQMLGLPLTSKYEGSSLTFSPSKKEQRVIQTKTQHNSARHKASTCYDVNLRPLSYICTSHLMASIWESQKSIVIPVQRWQTFPSHPHVWVGSMPLSVAVIM